MKCSHVTGGHTKETENAARMERWMVCGGFRLLSCFSCTYQGTRDINYCFLSHALSMPFVFDLGFALNMARYCGGT